VASGRGLENADSALARRTTRGSDRCAGGTRWRRARFATDDVGSSVLVLGVLRLVFAW